MRRSHIRHRTLDLILSVVLAMVTLPIVVVAAIGSAVALRTWPFFCQQRVGLDGQAFTFLKIRTLPTTVPAYIDKHALAAHEIPGFCRVLRACHLDELPQLYLVIAGRMSLVGPRPEMATLHERMHPGFAAERTAVRPGCTGLWQVSGACAELIHTTPGYDRFYLANRTVRLDLWVLGRTALKMIGLGSAVTLDQVPAWVLPAGSGTAEVLDLTQVDSDRDSPAPALGMSATAGR